MLKEPLSMPQLTQLLNISLPVKWKALKPVKEGKWNKIGLLASLPVCHQQRMPQDNSIAGAPSTAGLGEQGSVLLCAQPGLQHLECSAEQGGDCIRLCRAPGITGKIIT